MARSTRSVGDSWDLASSVGATATMVAAARAVASREPDRLIDDPYAAPLVRAVGSDFFTRVADGQITLDDGDHCGTAADSTTPRALHRAPKACSSICRPTQDSLFDSITALSAPGSRLATEYHPDAGASIGERTRALREQWAGHGFDVDIADLFYAGGRTPAADYLRAHGWQVSARTRPEVFAGYGRRFEITDELAPLRDSLALIAVKPDGEEGSR